MDYTPKFFQPYELVSEKTYTELKERPEKLWQIFDPRVLYTADKIREFYGKMIANTWYWGGAHQYRGWRPLDCSVGARWSQHKFGRAIDLVSTETAVEEIRQDIKLRRKGHIFQYITCIEDGVDWLHFDVRNYKGLYIVKPIKEL